MCLLLQHIHKPLQIEEELSFRKHYIQTLNLLGAKEIYQLCMRKYQLPNKKLIAPVFPQPNKKQTLYKTESDLSPSSFVMAAKACTAYLACLRLPSKHSLSNIRSMELQVINSEITNIILTLIYEGLGITSQKIQELHLNESARESASCSRMVPPALARTCKTPSFIISSSSLRKFNNSPSEPLSSNGQKRARI